MNDKSPLHLKQTTSQDSQNLAQVKENVLPAAQTAQTAQNTAIESGCVGVAVEILGDKWTAHIISTLADQPRRFSQVREMAGGVNPRTLSERLGRLEHCGIISKHVVSAMPPHTEYALTKKGADLLPILQSMAVWGNKYAPGVEQAEPKA